ncbi:hypothetical protein ACP275_01G062800 [Erythranthe tilingii]
MLGGTLNRGDANRRSRPYCFRRCKLSSSTNIESLPDDLLFQILLEVPAQDIQKGARLVCKKWHRIICNRRFVDAHLHHSTPGIIVDIRRHSSPAVFAATGRGRVEISKFNFVFRDRAPASCNGLIVEDNYISNPATNKRFDLPAYSAKLGRGICYAIAYAEVSKQYKVVLMHCSKYNEPLEILKCAILTVGVDKSWRHLHMKNLSIGAPVTTDGFVHWPRSDDTHVLTLNVETEIFTETPVPKVCVQRPKYYMSTGKSLSLLVLCGGYSFEVWEMKPEMGEWTKLFKIDLEPLKGRFGHLVNKFCLAHIRLIGWLNYPEVLALRISASQLCVIYNVRTQEIDYFEVYYLSGYHNYGVHRNSLVWLSGC